jgi:hypothetical protein
MKIEELHKLPQSQMEARERGSVHFYTGVRCKHGHVAARYTTTTQCVSCQLEHGRRNGGWEARSKKQEYLERARQIVEARGGSLLSTEYVSAKTKLQVRCGRGHTFEATPDNLKRGRWCADCKWENQAQRLAENYRSVEELREFALRRHGGDCLASRPSPILSKVFWKCAEKEHPPFEATIAKVFHSGSWCPACWQDRRQPPNPAVPFDAVAELVLERGGEIIRIGKDGAWNGSKTRLNLRCANRHEWSADASNLLYAGSWCPICLNKGECRAATSIQ